MTVFCGAWVTNLSEVKIVEWKLCNVDGVADKYIKWLPIVVDSSQCMHDALHGSTIPEYLIIGGYSGPL